MQLGMEAAILALNGGRTQEQDIRDVKVLGKTIPDWLIVDHYALSEKGKNSSSLCAKYNGHRRPSKP